MKRLWKYTVTYLIYPVAEYFNHIQPLDGLDIVDWGCNHGNFLVTDYPFKSYTGVDINAEIIGQMQVSHPNHSWVHYNQYNWQYSDYNYPGPASWPDLPQTDLICSYSVFTHMPFPDMQQHIAQFRTMLRDGGKMLLTYLDVNDENAMDVIFKHREEYFNSFDNSILKEQIMGATQATLAVNTDSWDVFVLRDMLEVPRFGRQTYFLHFYDGEWLAKELGGQIVDVTHKYRPESILATQKCLVLEK